MKVIAHRANLNGSETWLENKPQQIDKCINLGYDVEVDVRYDTLTRVFWLGHDEPQYQVTWSWMSNYQNHLWIHCKDVVTLHEFSTQTNGYNFFFHDKDDYTLTSKQYIWAYPGKSYTDNTVIVMPEWKDDTDWNDLKSANCYGICTDYPERLV